MNTEQAPRNMLGRGEACFGNTPCKGAVGETERSVEENVVSGELQTAPSAGPFTFCTVVPR